MTSLCPLHGWEHQIDLRLERGLRALGCSGMKTEDMRRMDLGGCGLGQQEAEVTEVKSSILLAKIRDKREYPGRR